MLNKSIFVPNFLDIPIDMLQLSICTFTNKKEKKKKKKKKQTKLLD